MSPVRMSRIEKSIRAVLEFSEAFNRHDVAGMIQLMSDDCVYEYPKPAPDGTVYSGKEAITQFWQGSFYKSPQAHLDIEEIFSLGDRCILRWKYEEEEKPHLRGVDIFKVKDGAICEIFSYIKG